jgi:hypothetical protein
VRRATKHPLLGQARRCGTQGACQGWGATKLGSPCLAVMELDVPINRGSICHIQGSLGFPESPLLPPWISEFLSIPTPRLLGFQHSLELRNVSAQLHIGSPAPALQPCLCHLQRALLGHDSPL